MTDIERLDQLRKKKKESNNKDIERLNELRGIVTADSIINDLDSLNSMKSSFDYSNSTYNTAQQNYSNALKQVQDYTSKSYSTQNKIKTYLEKNDLDKSSQKYLSDILKSLENDRTGISEYEKYRRSELDYYSQFKDESDYDIYTASKAKSSDEIKGLIGKSKERETEHKETNGGAFKNFLKMGMYGEMKNTAPDIADDLIERSLSQRKEAKNLEWDTITLQKRYADKVHDELVSELDKEKLADIDNYIKAKENYELLSRNKIDATGFAVQGQTSQQKAAYDTMMSYSEKLNDLENKDNLIEARKRKLDEIDMNEILDKTKAFASKHPVMSSIGSVAIAPAKIAALRDALSPVDDLYGININTASFVPARISKAIREQVMEDYDWTVKEFELLGYKFDSFDAFDFLYSTGLSILESFYAGYTGAAFGGAIGAGTGLAASVISGGIIGSQAGIDAIIEATEKGLPRNKALMAGATSALFETLFESVSIEQWKRLQPVEIGGGFKSLFTKSGIKTMLRNSAKSALTNASEETLTEIANMLYDTVANGDFSDIRIMQEQIKAELLAENLSMSDEEAENIAISKAFNKMALRAVEAGAGGALMGMLVGSGVKPLQRTLGIGQYDTSLPLGQIDVDTFTKAAEIVETSRLQGQEQTINDTSLLKAEGLSTELTENAIENIETADKETSGISSRVTDIESVKDGKVLLKLDDGGTIYSEDADFLDGRTKELYEKAGQYDTNTAKLFMAANTDTKADLDKSTNAFNAYYKAGLDGTRLDFLEKYVSPEYKEVFGDDVTKKIYEYGKIKQEKRQARKSKGKGSIRYDVSIANDIQLSAGEQSEITLLGNIAQLMNIDVVVYADEKGSNGWYNPNTDEIAVNLKGDYAILQTAAHELVHHMKETNPNAYEALVDYVVNSYGETETLDVLIKRQQELARNSADSPRELSYAGAIEEIVANACQNALHDKSAFETLVNNNSSELAKTLREWLDSFIQTIKKALESVKRYSAEYNTLLALQADMKELQRLFNEGLIGEESAFGNEILVENVAEIKYSYKGKNKNGIEVYETSKETKSLSYKERMAKFLDIMINQYMGRTAKLTRNGHAYYATFEESDVRKNIYGDTRSDKKGQAAKIKVGADGNIFELVENSKYNGSKQEVGKNAKVHKGIKYWDYFVKTVQIDGQVFDLVANVRKTDSNQYTYSIQLNKNKKIEAAPSLNDIKNAAFNRMLTTSDITVSQSEQRVKSIIRENTQNDTHKSSKSEKKLSVRETMQDSSGKELTPEQAEFFKDSKVVDEDGNLLVVYHGTNAEFTVFDKSKYNSNENEGDYVGEGFFFSKNSSTANKYGKNIVSAYINIENPLIIDTEKDAKDFRQTFLGMYKNGDSDLRKLLGGMYDYFEIAKENPALIRGELIRRGYDGLIDNLYNQYAVFDSNQIKSTDNLNPTDSEDIRYSYRENTPTNREILTDALLNAEYLSAEDKNRLQIYQKKIDKLNALQNELGEVKEQIKDISFTKGTDRTQLPELIAKSDSLSKKITLADKSLVRVEAMKPIQNIMNQITKEQMRKGKAELREYKQERKATAARREYLASIESTVSDLLKWTNNPKQNKSVPTELQGDVLKVISILNLESGVGDRRGNTQHDIKWQEAIGKVLERLSKDSDNENEATLFVELPTTFVEAFKEFINSANIKEAESIYDLDTREIEYIATILKMVKGTIQNANKSYAEERTVYISDLAKEQIAVDDKRDIKALRKYLDANFFSFDQMDSYTYAKVLGGTAESHIIKNLQKGQKRQIELLKTAINAFLDISTDTEWKEWFGRSAKVSEYQLESGSIKLTTGQLISLYLTANREQGLQHILGGGIRADEYDFKNVKRDEKKKTKDINTSPVTVTELDLVNLFSNLTDEQVAFGIKLRDFLSDDVAKWGNEVTQKLWLYDGYTEKNYWSIQSDKDFTTTKDSDVQSAGLWAIKNQSFTKQLVKGANNPIIITDALSLWVEHISNMATYNAYTLPLADAMRWFNFKESTPIGEDGTQRRNISVKDSMYKAYGKNAAGYFINLVKDINGTTERERGVEWHKKFTQRTKAAAVGFNLSVAIQQPTAYFRAGMVLDYKYLMQAMKDKPNVELSKEYCPIAWWKSQGFFSTDVGPGMYELITGDKSAANKVRDAQMWLAGKADEVTWGVLWNAVAYEIADTTDLKKGTEDFNKAVGARLADVIDQTQVVDSVFHRSQGMRSNSLYLNDLVYTFFTEQNKTLNLLMRAAVDSQRAGNSNTIRKAVFVSIVTAFVTSMAKSLVSALRDDDEDEEYIEKYKESLYSNIFDDSPFTSLPLLDKLISLYQGFKNEPLALSGFVSAFNAWKYATKFFAEYDEMSPTDKRNNAYKAIYAAAQSASQASGIAASNILRELKGIYNLMTDKKIGKGYKVTDKYEILREAMVTGDTKKYDKTYDRLIEDGKTDDDIQAGIKTSIKKNDERIQQAVEAKAAAQSTGDYDKLYGIIDSIASDGFDRQMIVDIVNSAFNTYAKDKDELLTGKYADLITSVNKGWANNARKIVKEFQEQGVKPETIRSSVTQGVKPYYFELKYKAIQGDTSAKAELSDLKKNLRGLELGYKYDTFTGWDKEFIEWRKEKYGR